MLTVKQAGELSGLGERFVRRLVDERRMPFHRVAGTRIRIAESDLEALIESGRCEPAETR